jgi:hypothetical protein
MGMGTCGFCDQELNDSESCTKNVILFRDPTKDDGGTWRFAVPFGDETRGITDHLDHSDSPRCHDCGVQMGGFHHPGCDVEENPRSGGQLLLDVISTAKDTRPYHGRAQADPHHALEFDFVAPPEN